MKKMMKAICAVLLLAAMCVTMTGCDLRAMIAEGAGGVASVTATEKKDPIVGIIQAIDGNTITLQVFKKSAVSSNPEDTSSKATTSYLVMENFPMDQYDVTNDTKEYTVRDNVPLFIRKSGQWVTVELSEFKVKDLIVVYTDGVAGESVWKLQ